MKNIAPFLLALSVLSLAGCSTPAPDKVEQINRLPVPLVMPGAKVPSAQTSHIAALYNANKQNIDTLTFALKKQYLQDVKTKDIFEMDSDIQPVYASLSKLEQLGLVNQQYLKDKNEMGLQQIHVVLKPLITG